MFPVRLQCGLPVQLCSV